MRPPPDAVTSASATATVELSWSGFSAKTQHTQNTRLVFFLLQTRCSPSTREGGNTPGQQFLRKKASLTSGKKLNWGKWCLLPSTFCNFPAPLPLSFFCKHFALFYKKSSNMFTLSHTSSFSLFFLWYEFCCTTTIRAFRGSVYCSSLNPHLPTVSPPPTGLGPQWLLRVQAT